MAITNFIFVIFIAFALFQALNAEENKLDVKGTSKRPFNPLEDLILNENKNEPKKELLSRVKRQYGYYGSSESDSSESDESASSYEGRYPDYYPVPIIVGFGGGFGFGGGGFGGRGFGGRGFGGRGFGGGFGGRGIGGRGFGGGFGGRGIGGGFGGGRGGGGGRG